MQLRVLSAAVLSVALALAPAAQAAWHHGYRGHPVHHGGGGAAIGAAIAGGIIGLGLGAAAASNGYGYPPPPVYYGAPAPYSYAPPPPVYYGYSR
jgi:hypothetical protein